MEGADEELAEEGSGDDLGGAGVEGSWEELGGVVGFWCGCHIFVLTSCSFFGDGEVCFLLGFLRKRVIVVVFWWSVSGKKCG